MSRVPKGMALGAIVGLLLTAVWGALYCGFNRTYLMVPAPDFMSGARFGAFYYVVLAGAPVAVTGVIIGGIFAAMTGDRQFRWSSGRAVCSIAVAGLLMALLVTLLVVGGLL